jgi:hypothetical protein
MMPTKVICCLLIASLIISFGCHNTQEMTRDDLTKKTKEALKAECEPFDVTVRTAESGAYKFLKDHFRINGDTLTGIGTQDVNGTPVPWRGSMALSDISSIETKEFSATKTILIIVIPAGVVTGFLLMVAEEMSHI